MDTIVFAVLIFNISLDAFIMMMEKGATILKLDLTKAIKNSSFFAIMNTLLFIIGHNVASQIFTDHLKKVNQVLLIMIFLIIGIWMIMNTFQKAPFEEKLDIHFNTLESFKIATLSGIDCLFMGFGCYYINISIVYQYLIVFMMTFIVVFGALYIGYYQGASYQKGLHYLCGSIYIVLAMILILGLI